MTNWSNSGLRRPTGLNFLETIHHVSKSFNFPAGLFIVLVALFECMFFQALLECFLSSLTGVVDRGKLGFSFGVDILNNIGRNC